MSVGRSNRVDMWIRECSFFNTELALEGTVVLGCLVALACLIFVCAVGGQGGFLSPYSNSSRTSMHRIACRSASMFCRAAAITIRGVLCIF